MQRPGRAGTGFADMRIAGMTIADVARRSVAVAAVLALLALVLFPTGAGIPGDDESRLMDLAPLTPAQVPVSTPREQWERGTMPHLYQTDPAWSSLPYGGGTVAQNACGPTCLAMVRVLATGDASWDPGDMAAYADEGGYAPTGATEWRFMTEGAAGVGLEGRRLSPTRDGVSQALRDGDAVICSVRPGDFTLTGHFIVLYGIDEFDRVGVYDPNSSLRSVRRWGIVEVLNQTNMCWAFSV